MKWPAPRHPDRRPAPEGPPPRATWSWRDAALTATALDLRPDDDVLVLDDAGDEALSLLAGSGARITCACSDPGGRALLALKAAALAELPVQSVHALLGLDAFGRRVWFYHHLRPGLEPAHQAWWDAREPMVREGIAEGGRVERQVRHFRERLLPAAVGSRRVAALFACADLEAQRRVAARWPRRRWRAALALLGGRLRQATGAPLRGGDLARRLDHLLAATPATTSGDLQRLLLGRTLDEGALPRWLQPGGHAAARAGLERLRVVDRRALADLPAGRFSAVALGAGGAVPGQGPAALARLCRPGARLAGWFPSGPPDGGALEWDAGRSADLQGRDRSFLWGAFAVGTRR